MNPAVLTASEIASKFYREDVDTSLLMSDMNG